jgi:hypothetical protein
MKKLLRFGVTFGIAIVILKCTKIDYAILKNESEDKITVKVNGRLFSNDKKTVLIKQEGNFFEYEMQPKSEEFVAEFYNSKFDENVFGFDTLIIVSKNSSLKMNNKTEIFNEFKTAIKGDFVLIVKK